MLLQDPAQQAEILSWLMFQMVRKPRHWAKHTAPHTAMTLGNVASHVMDGHLAPAGY